jgi:hypothetical protein
LGHKRLPVKTSSHEHLAIGLQGNGANIPNESAGLKRGVERSRLLRPDRDRSHNAHRHCQVAHEADDSMPR